MRLVIDREAADRSEIPFRIALQLIVLLDLHDPGTKKRLRFLTRSRVQNIYEGHKSKSMEVGVKFTDLGQLKKDGTYDVAWRDISDEGITALSDWVLRLFQDQEATVTVDRDGEDPAEEQEETQADA